jgi:glycosyltransferase involved in cell wall biosynthesis
MVVHHFFPRDMRVRREARALAQDGYEVSVFCLQMPGEPKCERWQDIEIFRQPIMRHRGQSLPVYLSEYSVMTALCAKSITVEHWRMPFDVVHVHTPPDFLVAAGLAAKLTGSKLVLDIHDLSPELYGTRFGGTSKAKWLLSKVEQGACRLADRVITVTQVFKKSLLERSVPEDKVVVLRNCPDEEIFTPTSGKVSRAGKSFRVMHHGTLMHRYGVDVLVRAFSQVVEEIPEAHLDIFGEGDLEDELKAMIIEKPLAGRVSMCGDVSQENIAQELQNSDLCVVPNRSDSFTDMLLPTKLLEALRMGCATIASATPMIEESFPEGVCLAKPGDAADLAKKIIALARDEKDRRRLGAQGRKAVESYSWGVEKMKLLDLYGKFYQE